MINLDPIKKPLISVGKTIGDWLKKAYTWNPPGYERYEMKPWAGPTKPTEPVETFSLDKLFKKIGEPFKIKEDFLVGEMFEFQKEIPEAPKPKITLEPISKPITIGEVWEHLPGEMAKAEKWLRVLAVPWKRDKYIEEKPEEAMRYIKQYENLIAPIVRKMYPTKFPLALAEKIVGRKLAVTFEEVAERSPVSATIGGLMGDIYNLVSLSVLTGGISNYVKVPGDIAAKLPWLAQFVPRAAHGGATWGLKGVIDESLSQFEKGEFEPGKIASEGGKNAVFGVLLAGASSFEPAGLRIVTGGVARGGWVALETYLREGKITSEDLPNIGANAILGMIFNAINAKGVTARMKQKRFDVIIRNQAIITAERAVGKANAPKMVDLLSKFGMLQRMPPAIVEQVKLQIPKGLHVIAQIDQVKMADTIMKSVKIDIRAGVPVWDSIVKALQSVGFPKIDIPIGMTIKEVGEPKVEYKAGEKVKWEGKEYEVMRTQPEGVRIKDEVNFQIVVDPKELTRIGEPAIEVKPEVEVERKETIEDISDTAITTKLKARLKTLKPAEDNADKLLVEGNYQAYVEGWCNKCFPKDIDDTERSDWAAKETSKIVEEHRPSLSKVIEAGYIKEEVGENPWGATYVIYQTELEPIEEVKPEAEKPEEVEEEVLIVKKGEYVMNDEGEILEVTSGNDEKWPNKFLKELNEGSIRAKKIGEKEDFLWYANRIRRLTQKEMTKAGLKEKVKPVIEEVKDEYRITPEEQDKVPDIVKEGDIIRSSDSETKYRVEKVTGPYTEGLEEKYPPHYSLTLSNLDAKRTVKGELPTNYNYAYINELVAVDGKIKHLFKANTDEVLVIEKGKPVKKMADLFKEPEEAKPKLELKALPVEEETLRIIESTEKELREVYKKDIDRAEDEMGKIMTELDLAEAGKRIIIKTGRDYAEVSGMVAQSSSFPKYIPEELRSKKLFDKVGDNLINLTKIKYPSGNRQAQRELYNAILDELDSRLDINTSEIRTRIMENHEKIYKKEVKEVISERIERREKLEIPTGKITAPVKPTVRLAVKRAKVVAPTITPEVLKRSNELIKVIYTLVSQKGLTKKAFSNIKMKYGGSRHLVSKYRRMSVEQLEAVFKAVKRTRPVRIGWKRVITRKTEKAIESLRENLIKRAEMTPADFDKILRKEGLINRKTGATIEPKYIDAYHFITQTKAKDIIRRMIDEAEIIKQTESFNLAVKDNPAIARKIEEIDKRIATMREKKPRDPRVLESMRYYNQQAEIITGAPIFTIYQDLIDTHSEVVKIRADRMEGLKESTPLFKKIASDEKALERISNYISSKSYLKDRPAKPVNITSEEIKLANAIEKILKGYEHKVRIAKFFNYYYYNKPIADYDRYKSEINKAVDIFESQGKNAVMEYLKEQEWGVIKSGYEPLQVANPKIRLYKIGSASIGKGHVQIRLDPTFHPQEKNILQRLSSYMRQMDMLADIQPKMNAMVRLYDDNFEQFADPQKVKGNIERFFNEIKGYGIEHSFFGRVLARLYSQAMRVIIMPSPALAFRNLGQNLAFEHDKSILIDPRNKNLTNEDIEYLETYVLQTRPMMEDWFMTQEKPLPGLGFLTGLVDKVKIYPWSDLTNRHWSFWAKKSQVDRALKAKTLDGMMDQAKFDDISILEQKRALNIKARDGDQAMSRYLARVHVDDIHFLYERAQRSPAEMGTMGRVLGNLMLFPRAYWEKLIRANGKLMGKNISYKERWRGLKILFAVIIGGLGTGMIYKQITGRRKNPYNPLELLAYEPGGLMLGTIDKTGEVYANIIRAVSGDKEALKRLDTAIPGLADMFIPFYAYALRGIEASTDMKNIDRMAIRKIRALIDKEYEVRGGAYELERSALEKWQYFIGGAGVDVSIKEKEAEKKKKKPVKIESIGKGIKIKTMGEMFKTKKLETPVLRK